MSHTRDLSKLARTLDTGTSGQVLTSQAGSNFSFADASGGGGGSYQATASGAIADGDPIVVNTNGTVSKVSQSNSTVKGNTLDVTTHDPAMYLTLYDPDAERIIVFYQDSNNSHYPTVKIGTIASGSITFTTPQVVASSAVNPISMLALSYDSTNDRYFFGWGVSGGYGQVRIGSIAANKASVEFGSAPTGSPTGITGIETFGGWQTSHDPTGNKLLSVYYASDDTRIKTRVLSPSGTGGSATYSVSDSNSGTLDDYSYPQHLLYESNSSKHVLIYNTGYAIKAVLLSLSGTTITFNSVTSVVSAGVTSVAAAIDTTNNKVVLVYNSSGFYTVVGSISGTSISFGTAVSLGGGGYNNYLSGEHLAFAGGKMHLLHRGTPYNSSLAHISFEVSGTSVTNISSRTELLEENARHSSLVFDSSNSTFGAFYNDHRSSENYKGKVILFTSGSSSNLTADNFIGLSDGAYANGATATIQTAGAVDDAQSGLTAGTKYYLAADGSLQTSASNPSVEVGVAVSATKLIVKG